MEQGEASPAKTSNIGNGLPGESGNSQIASAEQTYQSVEQTRMRQVNTPPAPSAYMLQASAGSSSQRNAYQPDTGGSSTVTYMSRQSECDRQQQQLRQQQQQLPQQQQTMAPSKTARQLNEEHLLNVITIQLGTIDGAPRQEGVISVINRTIGDSITLITSGYRTVVTWRDLCIHAWRLTPLQRVAVIDIKYDVPLDTLSVRIDRNRIPTDDNSVSTAAARASTQSILSSAQDDDESRGRSLKRTASEMEGGNPLNAKEGLDASGKEPDKRGIAEQSPFDAELDMHVQRLSSFNQRVVSVAQKTEPMITYAAAFGAGKPLDLSSEVVYMARSIIELDTRSGQSNLMFNVISYADTASRFPNAVALFESPPDATVVCTGIKKLIPEFYNKECPGSPHVDWMITVNQLTTEQKELQKLREQALTPQQQQQLQPRLVTKTLAAQLDGHLTIQTDVHVPSTTKTDMNNKSIFRRLLGRLTSHQQSVEQSTSASGGATKWLTTPPTFDVYGKVLLYPMYKRRC